jgi:hypothetical protein
MGMGRALPCWMEADRRLMGRIQRMDPLAHRVARRFTAELLTKQWLMAVRRGWLSLLKPPVHDFDDVFRAIGRLYQFVKNLREQVYNVRQTIHKPVKGEPGKPPDKTEGNEIEKKFNTILTVIEDAGSRAEHWKNAYEGKGLGGPNESERTRAEQMLNLYKTDFEEGVSGWKEPRSGHSRAAPLTEFLDDILKLLYAEAKELGDFAKKREEIRQQSPNTRDMIDRHPIVYADPVFKEFMFSGVKVVVVDPQHHGQRIREYVQYIEMAHKDIVRKGFGKVWYGVFFLMSDDYEKLSKEEQAAYEKAGYKSLEQTAGSYHSGSDVIKITAPPSEEIVRVLAHELGHRYWFKAMTGAQRAKFESIIEGDWTMAHAILLNHHLLGNVEHQLYSHIFAKLEAGHDISVDEKKLVREKFKELGIRAGVPLISDYSRSRPTEAFAEVFERYVVEKDMTRDQVESFRSVLSSDFLLIAEALREEPCAPAPYSYSRS